MWTNRVYHNKNVHVNVIQVPRERHVAVCEISVLIRIGLAAIVCKLIELMVKKQPEILSLPDENPVICGIPARLGRFDCVADMAWSPVGVDAGHLIVQNRADRET